MTYSARAADWLVLRSLALAIAACSPTDPGPAPPGGDVQLSVRRSGGGTGTVRSEPAGIDCGASCQATFAAGARIRLSATADAGSTFTGWSGPCTGGGPCDIELGASVEVEAVFGKPGAPPQSPPLGLCTPGGFCWESPLPQGSRLLATWAAAPTDVWAVGSAGVVLHFDGRAWSYVKSGTTASLYAVHGTGPRDIWIAGEGGTVLRWDGDSLKAVPSGTDEDLRGV